MGRKSGLFAHSIPSLDARFAELEVEIAESLRPSPRIFPFWGDRGRRRVRSGLPPDVTLPISRTAQSNVAAALEAVRGLATDISHTQACITGDSRFEEGRGTGFFSSFVTRLTAIRKRWAQVVTGT